MKLKVLLVILLLTILLPTANAAGNYHIENYRRDIEIYSDLSYTVHDTISLLGTLSDGVELSLGDYSIDQVKVNSVIIPKENYTLGNKLNLVVESGKTYNIDVSGHGILRTSGFMTTISDKSKIDDISINVLFKFTNFQIISTYPTPNYQTSTTLGWVFSNTDSITVSASWIKINNTAQIKTECHTLLLVDSINRLKLYCDVTAEDYINQLTINLPEGLIYESSNMEKTSTVPLVLKLTYPSKSFRLNLALKTDSNSISMPDFENALEEKINLALYRSENYKVENITSTFDSITKYEATFLNQLEIPENYREVAYYRGYRTDTVSFNKQKLEGVEHLATIIDEANYDIFPTKRGFAVVKASYMVVNTETGKYLTLELPEDAVLWGVIVKGEPETAFGEGNRIEIALPVSAKYGATYEKFRVTVFYVVAKDVFKRTLYSTYQLLLPTHNPPITKMYVKVGIPSEFYQIRSVAKPEMEIEIIEQKPVRYIEPVKFGVAGAAQKQMAARIEEISIEKPTQQVELTQEGVPVVIEIPETKKYLKATGYTIMPSERVEISIYGFEKEFGYIILGIIVLVVAVFTIKYKKKIKKIIW